MPIFEFWGASRESKVKGEWKRYEVSAGEINTEALISLACDIYSYLRTPWALNRREWRKHLSECSINLIQRFVSSAGVPLPDELEMLTSWLLYLSLFPEFLFDVRVLGTLRGWVVRLTGGNQSMAMHTRLLLAVHLVRMTNGLDERRAQMDRLYLELPPGTVGVHDGRQRARVWRGYALVCAEFGWYWEVLWGLVSSHVAAGRCLDVHAKTLVAWGCFFGFRY